MWILKKYCCSCVSFMWLCDSRNFWNGKRCCLRVERDAAFEWKGMLSLYIVFTGKFWKMWDKWNWPLLSIRIELNRNWHWTGSDKDKNFRVSNMEGSSHSLGRIWTVKILSTQSSNGQSMQGTSIHHVHTRNSTTNYVLKISSAQESFTLTIKPNIP